MNKAAKALKEFYDPKEYSICEIKALREIRKDLESNSAAAWSAGEIKGTEYFKLLQFSPAHAGDKIPVFVCKTKLVNLIREAKK